MGSRKFLAVSAGALLALPLSVSALILAPPPTGGGGSGSSSPPDCSQATPSVSVIWPPNHKMVPVQINGITDPNGLQVTVSITGIMQDEPVESGDDGHKLVDGNGVGTPTAFVRAERSRHGTGRIYFISFTATDTSALSCSNTVEVYVPREIDQGSNPTDTGKQYDSTVPAARHHGHGDDQDHDQDNDRDGHH
jgi:hypothetical protein